MRPFRQTASAMHLRELRTQIHDYAERTTALLEQRRARLDGLIAGRTWIVGERFTLADILLYCFLTFGAQVGQPRQVGAGGGGEEQGEKSEKQAHGGPSGTGGP